MTERMANYRARLESVGFEQVSTYVPGEHKKLYLAIAKALREGGTVEETSTGLVMTPVEALR